MIGVGYKLTNAFRLKLSGVIYNQEFPNYISSSKKLTILPTVSFSLDLSIKRLIGDIQSVFKFP